MKEIEQFQDELIGLKKEFQDEIIELENLKSNFDDKLRRMRVESTNKSKDFRHKIKEISAVTDKLKENKMQLNNLRSVNMSMSRDNNRLRSQLSTMKYKVEAEKIGIGKQ